MAKKINNTAENAEGHDHNDDFDGIKELNLSLIHISEPTRPY